MGMGRFTEAEEALAYAVHRWRDAGVDVTVQGRASARLANLYLLIGKTESAYGILKEVLNKFQLRVLQLSGDPPDAEMPRVLVETLSIQRWFTEACAQLEKYTEVASSWQRELKLFSSRDTASSFRRAFGGAQCATALHGVGLYTPTYMQEGRSAALFAVQEASVIVNQVWSTSDIALRREWMRLAATLMTTIANMCRDSVCAVHFIYFSLSDHILCSYFSSRLSTSRCLALRHRQPSAGSMETTSLA